MENHLKGKSFQKIPAVSLVAAVTLPCDAFRSRWVTSCYMSTYLKMLPVMSAPRGTGIFILAIKGQNWAGTVLCPE